MVQVQFDNTVGVNGNLLSQLGYSGQDAGRTLFVFAAADTDPGSGLRPIPVESYDGVPEYYLIHVVNPNTMAVVGRKSLGDLSAGLIGTLAITIDNVSYNINLNSANGTNIKDYIQGQIDAVLPPVAGKKVVTVDYLSNSRLGLWLTGNATSMNVALTGAATSTLGLSSGMVHRSNLSIGVPPEPFSEYSLTLKAAPISGSGEELEMRFMWHLTAIASLDIGNAGMPTHIPIGDFNGDTFRISSAH